MKAWFDFLADQKTQPLQANNSICALRTAGILYVGGDDAGEFLQNQLSNDITLINEQQCQISSSSNSKGRMYGIYRAVQIEGGYLLLMPHSILQEVQQRLQKYILRSKVVLADISDSFAQFSLSTDNPKLLVDLDIPQGIHQVTQSDSLITIRLHAQANSQRLLFITNNADEAITIWQRFAQQLSVNDESAWAYQEMLAGIPALYPATLDAFVLQMCNLDLVDGVSFKKGCYPGQEVVARTHYLGKLKRRMFLARLDSQDCPKPGDELTSRGNPGADGSGKVVDAVKSPQDGCLVQFVARIDKATTDDLVIVNQPDSPIQIIDLPYSLPELE